MTRDDIKAAALEELTTVAPDLADETIPNDADLREAFDLDSMDFLNWVAALHRRLGVDIPELDYPRLRVARFSGAALTEGIQTHHIEGVEVRIYSPAKTVVDCFKFRNKIGIDVAIEALRDFSRRHRGGASDLAHFARICRVTRVMQPYLDAMTGPERAVP